MKRKIQETTNDTKAILTKDTPDGGMSVTLPPEIARRIRGSAVWGASKPAAVIAEAIRSAVEFDESAAADALARAMQDGNGCSPKDAKTVATARRALAVMNAA